jgi:hypothetical protein
VTLAKLGVDVQSRREEVHEVLKKWLLGAGAKLPGVVKREIIYKEWSG